MLKVAIGSGKGHNRPPVSLPLPSLPLFVMPGACTVAYVAGYAFAQRLPGEPALCSYQIKDARIRLRTTGA